MTANFSQDCFAFDNETAKKIGIGWMVVSSFSLLASTLVLVVLMVLCAKRKRKRGRVQLLPLWFTFTVIFQAPSCILQSAAIDYDTLTVNRPLCVAAGLYNQYSSWLVNLTILWIALYLFRLYIVSVFHCGTRVRVRNRTIGAVILPLVLAVPIPFSLVPLWGRKYGVVDAWCWIVALDQNNCSQKDALGIAYQYAFWFAPFLSEVIALNLLSVAIFLIFWHGYKKNSQGQFAKREYYKRMQEFLPLLLSLLVYSLLCIFQVASFTTDLLNRPRFVVWIGYVVVGKVKELVVLVGYLITVKIMTHRGEVGSKGTGLANTSKGKGYRTFTPTCSLKESVDTSLNEKEGTRLKDEEAVLNGEEEREEAT